MLSRCRIRRLAVIGVLVCVAALPAFAEDVEKKFRVGLALGGFNPQDKVKSQAANVLVLVDENQVPSDLFVDPRNDSAVFGELGIQSAGAATVYGQYAVTKVFILEASLGYSKHDVGEVEIQAQFPAQNIPEELGAIDMSFYRVPLGELERIPIQFTALARFRPRASFNPYVGAGIGYSFIGFEPGSEFDDLSVNLDNSVGAQAVIGSSFSNNPGFQLPPQSALTNLVGASVSAGDSFEWHLAGGAELSFRRNWTLFLDLRFTVASQSMNVTFNGTPDLGITVPNLRDFETSSYGSMIYGPFQLSSGGLVDGGSLQWEDRADLSMPATDEENEICVTNPTECEFAVGEQFQDGQLDPGLYYVQGGSFDYDGIGIQIGVRYTF